MNFTKAHDTGVWHLNATTYEMQCGEIISGSPYVSETEPIGKICLKCKIVKRRTEKEISKIDQIKSAKKKAELEISSFISNKLDELKKSTNINISDIYVSITTIKAIGNELDYCYETDVKIGLEL